MSLVRRELKKLASIVLLSPGALVLSRLGDCVPPPAFTGPSSTIAESRFRNACSSSASTSRSMLLYVNGCCGSTCWASIGTSLLPKPSASFTIDSFCSESQPFNFKIFIKIFNNRWHKYAILLHNVSGRCKRKCVHSVCNVFLKHLCVQILLG